VIFIWHSESPCISVGVLYFLMTGRRCAVNATIDTLSVAVSDDHNYHAIYIRIVQNKDMLESFDNFVFLK